MNSIAASFGVVTSRSVESFGAERLSGGCMLQEKPGGTPATRRHREDREQERQRLSIRRVDLRLARLMRRYRGLLGRRGGGRFAFSLGIFRHGSGSIHSGRPPCKDELAPGAPFVVASRIRANQGQYGSSRAAGR